MKVQFHEFDIAKFNTLPYFENARQIFTEQDGPAIITKTLGPLFRKHNVESLFGVGILHRHFELKRNEKLVDVRNITITWVEHGEGEAALGQGQMIVPCAWMVTDGQLMPYEFYLPPPGVQSIDLDKLQEFLGEFVATIVQTRLESSIALRLFRRPGAWGAASNAEALGIGVDELCSVMRRKQPVWVLGATVPATHRLLERSSESQWFFDEEWLEKGYSARHMPHSDTTNFQLNVYGVGGRSWSLT